MPTAHGNPDLACQSVLQPLAAGAPQGCLLSLSRSIRAGLVEGACSGASKAELKGFCPTVASW